jgi:hypothetical protein
MVRIQQGSVVSIQDALNNSQDATTGLPIKFSQEVNAHGIPTFRASVDDQDAKQVREYSFDLTHSQVVINCISTNKEDALKQKPTDTQALKDTKPLVTHK